MRDDDGAGFGGGYGEIPGWLRSEMKQSFAGASILVIEDDNDIRELLGTLLQLAGFQATLCATAERGLEELREQPFDFVLTDYALPNRSGAWLLRQAGEEGLLDATPVLVVTAHPEPKGVEGFEILQKPFDLDELVERVRQRLEQVPVPPRSSRPGVARRNASGRPGDDGRGDCPAPIELILYVSAHSPRSQNAISNIKRTLAQYNGNVRLTIHDLSKDPEKGTADSVAFTPTLVKRSPGPRTFILGHITNPQVLFDLLDACEPDS